MKLIIADDDKQIREGIKEGIDWKSLEIDEVFAAANGIEAFALFLQHTPEIVIADIKMPGMDGFQLFKKIKETKPDTKVLIISGYSDFEYLKKAIQFGAVDYELKPIKVGSLISLIKKLKEDILREKISQERMQIHLKAYKESFIKNLLLGNISDYNIILEGFQQYVGFDGRGTLFCMLLEFDYYILWIKNKTKLEIEKIDRLLNEFIDTHLLDEYKCFSYKIEENKFIVIIKTENSELLHNNIISNIKACIVKLNEYLKNELGLTVSAGISNVGNIFNICELYKQSKQSLEVKFYMGIESVYLYSESLIMEKIYIASQTKEEELKDGIGNFDINICKNIIDTEFNIIEGHYCYTKSSILSFCANLISILKKITNQYDNSLYEFIGNSINNLEKAAIFETLKDCRSYVLRVYEEVFNLYMDIKEISRNPIVFKAIIYIKNNYDKHLTVETLAEYVSKTPNYFSHIFKKETGMAFSEYVNKIRISRAKTLIVNSDLRIYEVAQKVGYGDYVYFTQIFKKIEGYSPTSLRNRNTDIRSLKKSLKSNKN